MLELQTIMDKSHWANIIYPRLQLKLPTEPTPVFTMTATFGFVSYNTTVKMKYCYPLRGNAFVQRELSVWCRVGVVKWFTVLCCSIHSRGLKSPPCNACGYIICKYVDWKGSATMLSAGVAPEVNLMITHARKYTSMGSTLSLKQRADITISPKTGVSLFSGPTKDLKECLKLEI